MRGVIAGQKLHECPPDSRTADPIFEDKLSSFSSTARRFRATSRWLRHRKFTAIISSGPFARDGSSPNDAVALPITATRE